MTVDLNKLTDKELKLYEYLKTNEKTVVNIVQAVDISPRQFCV